MASPLMLSDQQMEVIRTFEGGTLSWSFVERPVGPQPIPAWAKDFAVNWMEDYGNNPSFAVKVTSDDVFEWPDMRYRKDGAVYVAESEDGRIKQYGHAGAIVEADIKMFRRADGTLHWGRRHGVEWGSPDSLTTSWVDGTGRPTGYEPGEWVEAKKRATTQQDGFAGRHVPIVLDDGEDLVLRGPWHIGAPEGSVAVTTVDLRLARDRFWTRHGKPWWARGGCFGLFLKRDLFLRLIARFQPHLEVAEVTIGDWTWLEPINPAWGEPKKLFQARKAGRLQADA